VSIFFRRPSNVTAVSMRSGGADGDSGFDAAKARILAGLESEGPDASPQGHVDPLCEPVLRLINEHPDFVTTSSCSGRVSIFHTGADPAATKARTGGGWLLVSHDPVSPAQVIDALRELPEGLGLTAFKFEPFILHVRCRTLFAARTLLTAAVAAGYRNSGLMAGQRLMVAVRSTLHLDAPVAMDGRSVVNDTYLTLLATLSTQKFHENAARISAFQEELVRRWAESSPARTPAMRRCRAERDTRDSAPKSDQLNATKAEVVDCDFSQLFGPGAPASECAEDPETT